MPNSLSALGLTTATRDELVAYLTAQYQAIYGADITLASDTPDGQWMNLIIQLVLDQGDLLTQIYNSFDPDNAIGVVLDQRVTVNGIQRQAGTYTITPITIVNSQSVNLYGLDGVTTTPDVRDDGNAIYTVADNSGNNWFLQTTQIGLVAGTHVFNFRAAVPGAQLTIPNNINVPVTIVIGVTSVNNPTSYTTLGINEESDAVLKVRRQKAVSLASQGYLAGLLAALENITGVTSAFVYENNTDATDVDGIPSHTIWVIVAGTGDPAAIAQAIYTKRNAGAGMFGSQTFVVTQVDGSSFVVRWDDVVTRNLFIAFTATSINGVTTPNIEAIREGLPVTFVPAVFQPVNINELATLVQAIDPNTLVTGAGFSTGETQTLTLSGLAASGAFKVRYNGIDSAAINWNDAIGTIQTKVRAITGLSAAVVTGGISAETLIFDLSSVGGVLGLISTNSNTLLTAGSGLITFAYNEGYTTVLTPSSKQFQFVVSDANIVITPMLLTPATTSVSPTETVQFTGFGGYSTYTYAFVTNASGGTINASSGLYTAGASTSVTDTVKVTDVFGNSATANIVVA